MPASPPGGTLVDVFPIGDGLGVGSTAGIAALATLGLGQNIVDLIGDRVALGFEMDSGKAKQGAEGSAMPPMGEQALAKRKLRRKSITCLYQPCKTHKGE